jgi:hypothetical protein
VARAPTTESASRQDAVTPNPLTSYYPVSVWDRGCERVTSRIHRTVKTPT